MSCTDVRKRLVRREEASMKSGSRSANTDAGNSWGCDKRTRLVVNTKANGMANTGQIPGMPLVRTVDGRRGRCTLRAGRTGAV